MAEKKEEGGTDKIENIIAISVVVVLILGFIGFWNGWWGLFEKDVEDFGNPIVSTSIASEPVKGDPNAPVTIVEYADFECPFCGRFFHDTLPQIKAAYLDTGKAKLVYKQFPLTKKHPHAMEAAMASECAFNQGNDAFWKYHDILFENQQFLTTENLTAYAEQAGLDTMRFNLCLSSQDTLAEVEADYGEGVQSGVTGTPGFVIGRSGQVIQGELIIGSHPFATLSEIIERQ